MLLQSQLLANLNTISNIVETGGCYLQELEKRISYEESGRELRRAYVWSLGYRTEVMAAALLEDSTAPS